MDGKKLIEEYKHQEMMHCITRAISSTIRDKLRSPFYDLSQISALPESSCFVSTEELEDKFKPEIRVQELVQFHFKNYDGLFDLFNKEEKEPKEVLEEREKAFSYMREIVDMVELKLVDLAIKYISLKCDLNVEYFRIESN